MVITGSDNYWNCSLNFHSQHFIIQKDEGNFGITLYARNQSELLYDPEEFSFLQTFIKRPLKEFKKMEYEFKFQQLISRLEQNLLNENMLTITKCLMKREIARCSQYGHLRIRLL
jgi:hypothetical protein